MIENQNIFEEFYSQVFKFVIKMCHDESLAENIVGDSFAGLLENIERVTNVRGYLYQSAFHHVLIHQEFTRRHAPIKVAWNSPDDDDFRPVEVCIENRNSFEEHQVMLSKIFSIMQDQLTANERRVLILRFMQDCSVVQTAESMGVTLANAKIIQMRALQKLRKELGLQLKSPRHHGILCFYPSCNANRTHDAYCQKHFRVLKKEYERERYRKQAGWYE